MTCYHTITETDIISPYTLVYLSNNILPYHKEDENSINMSDALYVALENDMNRFDSEIKISISKIIVSSLHRKIKTTTLKVAINLHSSTKLQIPHLVYICRSSINIYILYIYIYIYIYI